MKPSPIVFRNARAVRAIAKHCAYCGDEFTRRNPATFDHVIPRLRGGTKATNNGLAACQHCNGLKGSLSLDEFFRRFPLAIQNVKAYLKERQGKKIDGVEYAAAIKKRFGLYY